MIKKSVNKIMKCFGYIPEYQSVEMMYANGNEYINAIKSNGLNMPYMLLANHLFCAAIELLMHNNEEFDGENNQYIQYHEKGIIDPPTATGLLMTYILNHPEENGYSLFNLAIRCVKAAEVNLAHKGV